MTEPADTPRDRALSRLYREGSQAAPGADLDAAILAAARRAVRPPPRPWWRRLQVPVALAATVMLAVMLSLTMERHPPAPVGSERSAPAQPQATTPPAAESRAVAPGPSATRPETGPAPHPPRAARAPATSTDTAAPRESTPPAPPAMAPPAPPPVAAESGAGPAREQHKALAAPAARDREAKREAPPPSAATWIEEIRALRRQGARQEADRRLGEFRAAYPDYPLPDDLR